MGAQMMQDLLAGIQLNSTFVYSFIKGQNDIERRLSKI
jgi:hypothetical protein